MMRARFLLPLAAATVSFGLAQLPAASAMDQMEKSNMSRSHSSDKSHSSMKSDRMGSKKSTKSGSMSKDSMDKKDDMSSGGMK
jgi:pentapeptide MXKDX repeat protein